MKSCDNCLGAGAGAAARTMTTVVVALASVIVMALAGARARAAFAGRQLIAPATLGIDPAPTTAPIAAEPGGASTISSSTT